jgi:N-acetylated-alpha-linked acidic dipeptidase
MSRSTVLLLTLALAACKARNEPQTQAPPPAGSAGSGSAAAPAVPSAPAAIDGFANQAAERAVEVTFLAVPTADDVKAQITALAAKPHMAGTPGDAEVATALASKLKALGFDVSVDEYPVYMPHPKKISIVVRGDKPIELATRERAGSRPIAADAPELYGWNAYSASGKVTAPAVLAGYGRDEEFAALAKQGIDVKGKIAILAYGPLYRGAQVASAERHGAAGVIFFPDPKDEPDRPRDTLQRGTVVYYWQYMGDPKQAPKQTPVLPKIPVANVTANEADKLLALVRGKGAAPVVELDVQLDDATRTIRDVVARIPGESSEEVVLGNHYDAWVFGALDPHSGTATLLEIARGIAKLRDGKWKPKRTIVIAFWDAEEFGVIGSSMWAVAHGKELKDAVAYFNIDTIKAGSLVVQGEPALRGLVEGCARDVVDPNTKQPFKPTFKDIGIGSDWTAFLHHEGVPSMMWQTGAGKGVYNVWHSVQDDTDYAGTKADPGFAFIPAYAQVMGVCALRLAGADSLPFHHAETATWLDKAIDDLAKTKPTLDKDALHGAVKRFADAAARADHGSGDKCNRARASIDRAFLAEDGLVDRPWYRNLALGPNPDNGYAPLPLPELAGARDATTLAAATLRLVAAIDHATATLADCGP